MTATAEKSTESRSSRSGSLAVVVVIPTYNEAENLPVLISALCDQKIENLGIIVVDDGSPDGTGEIADRLAGEYPGYFEVIHRPRKLGLGPAYVAGFRVALRTDAFAVIEMDADMSHPVADVPTLIEGLKSHHVVVGSRYIPGGSVDPSWSFPRRALSWLGNRGIRLLVGVKVKDATSGFKAFRSSTLRSLDLAALKSKGYAFQAELILVCERAGFDITEHPYRFTERASGQSKMSAGIVYEAVVTLLPLRFRRG